MCGRYASSRPDEVLVDDYDVDEVVGDPLRPSWNVAPTQAVRVVLDRRDEPDGGQRQEPARVRQLRTVRWGLVPFWAKDPSIGSRLINARAETVTEKPAFKGAAARRRCLVPADGYYEWERREGSARKVPHFLHREGRGLAFAGLYERWEDTSVPEDDPGRWRWTCTVLTTTAPDALGQIHDRCPVVVPEGLRDRWLDPGLTDLAAVRELLEAVPPPVLEPVQVSPAVNSVRNDGPELVRPVSAPEHSPR